jgi:hypothetical protein
MGQISKIQKHKERERMEERKRRDFIFYILLTWRFPYWFVLHLSGMTSG